MTQLSRHWKWIGLGLVTIASLAGVWLRTRGLGTDSFWLDEGYAAWMIDRPPGDIIHEIKSDTAPPLFYLLLHGWRQVFGFSETSLRGFSSFMSCATLAVVGAWAWRTRSILAAGIALLFCAANVLQIEFAREVRAYGLMLVEGALLLALMARWRRTGRRIDLVWLSLVALASLYTHNAMMFFVGTAAVLAPLWPGQPIRRRWADLVVAGVCVAVGYAPWIGTFLEQKRLLQGDFWVSPLTFETVVDVFSTLLGGTCYGNTSHLLSFVGLPTTGYAFWTTTLAAALLCLVPGLIEGDNVHRRRIAVLTGWVLIPLSIMTVLSVVSQPILMVKSLIGSSPAVAFAIAITLTLPMRKWLAWISRVGAFVLLGITICTTIGFFTDHVKEDWRSASSYVERLPPAERLLVFVANESQLVFDYYAPKDRSDRTGTPWGFHEKLPHRTMRRVLKDSDLDALRDKIARGGYTEVVLIQSHEWWADPGYLTFFHLTKTYPHREEKYFAYISVIRCFTDRKNPTTQP